MTLCPIAIAVGCRKCFAVAYCPLKSVIGDYRKPDATQPPGSSPEDRQKKDKSN